MHTLEAVRGPWSVVRGPCCDCAFMMLDLTLLFNDTKQASLTNL